MSGMNPLTQSEMLGSFVNMTKGAVKRLKVPALDDVPWADLDYFGWRDPQSPQRRYLIAERDGAPVGIALRASDSGIGRARKTMCSLCMSVGSVDLLVAQRAGRVGHGGHSVGDYMCSDLACSLRVRGKKATGPVMRETLSTDQKIARLVTNLDVFISRVVA